ncbi:uncharacterized protein BO72DRAFT_17138 [Aspergillus fijiensis CBS 313.89]|uniref:Uncharacterized protein n=1 Tax=Aspergillus fijiensis CBS 313.89 TaxID=1448319 RepID=A0A8G1RJ38_9EURO|nr:uncharacterized protein BO72DRAFT_17138 [Aspergillus fijiensis CBS 313.89]RAK71361.1 hypothetical protein BO72DRAFT_17138 [Aspergillus fijiensis CBS 313.89]
MVCTQTQPSTTTARLAQSAERETLNLKVAGSTPALGFLFCFLPVAHCHCTAQFARRFFSILCGSRTARKLHPGSTSCNQANGRSQV